uniref:Uncharacterized protein n=1 Tax=Amphimedon queenslandica TaxID=400682 RepID=A0A1X7T572_AMPQE
MATASSATFEVLCAFGVHRRRVTFASSTSGSNINAAKDAIKESFKDVLNDEEFFVQVFEKEGDWAGEFVDSGDTIPDHATLKIICSELSSEAGSSKACTVGRDIFAAAIIRGHKKFN